MDPLNTRDEAILQELRNIRSDSRYIANRQGRQNLSLLLWFVLVPGLLYGLFVGLLGIAHYLARHAAH